METLSASQTFVGPVYGATAAARRLAISPSYLHRLTREGRARPSVPTADGRRMFTEADLAAVAAQLVRAGDGKPEAA